MHIAVFVRTDLPTPPGLPGFITWPRLVQKRSIEGLDLLHRFLGFCVFRAMVEFLLLVGIAKYFVLFDFVDVELGLLGLPFDKG